MEKLTVEIRLALKAIRDRLAFYKYRHLPVERNKIVASAYQGRGYGDNTRAVIDALIKKNTEADIVLALNDAHFEDKIPEGIRKVRYGSMEHFRELVTAKVWIDNMRMLFGPPKREGQVYFQLWHGPVMLKKVEKDAVLSDFYVRKAKEDSLKADCFVSSGGFETGVYRSAFWYDGKILENGTPRLDRFINGSVSETEKKAVRQELGINETEKVVLYAPTFREGNDNCYDLDYSAVLDKLAEKTGENWKMMIRFHPNVSEKYHDMKSEDSRIINVTSYPDLYGLMPVVDMLITDYSSVMFEFSIVGKPVFLYASDLEEYTRKERDLYFSISELPYSMAETTQQFIKNVEEYDLNSYRKNVEKFFKEKLYLNETGHSAEIIADIIETVLKGD